MWLCSCGAIRTKSPDVDRTDTGLSEGDHENTGEMRDVQPPSMYIPLSRAPLEPQFIRKSEIQANTRELYHTGQGQLMDRLRVLALDLNRTSGTHVRSASRRRLLLNDSPKNMSAVY
jgi:hypothetical protein